MKTRITVLVDNAVAAPGPLLGEHGFAAWVEMGRDRVLFDTGRGTALLPNAAALGLDLARAGAVVLSHGHSDHSGGLAPLLAAFGPRTVVGHPGVFAARSWVKGDGSRRPIGIPHSREELEKLGAVFVLKTGWVEVAESVHATGQVPRLTPFESGDPTLVADATGAADPLDDDLTLVVEGEEGLLVLLGCAHAGVVNILRHVAARFPDRPIHTVLGGTHLGSAPAAQLAATIEALRGMGIARMGACHCTGSEAACRLRAALGERFFFAGAGTEVAA
jgi:7,8-dihydropterin-6-yl-methyl-4-(beta-D-ribofuranosyl)aminobenzene 5'-phosphate synthase